MSASASPAEPEPKPSIWRRLVYVVGPFLIWGAYAALLLPYVKLRSYGDEFMPWLDGAAIEHAIFRVNAPAVLQSWWYPGNQWLDFTGFVLHLSWFLLPGLLALAVMLFERNRLMELFAWLLVMSYLGNVMFFLFPLEPPWMDGGAVRILVERSFVEYTALDNNPVAAFPSFHAGLPMALTLFFVMRTERLRKLAWVALAATGLVSVAVVYLGEHWLIDVAGGWMLAAFTAWLMTSKRVRGAVSRVPGDPVAKAIALNNVLCIYGGKTKPTIASPEELDEFAPRRRAA